MRVVGWRRNGILRVEPDGPLDSRDGDNSRFRWDRDANVSWGRIDRVCDEHFDLDSPTDR